MQHSEILSYDEYARIEKEGFPSPYVVEAGHDEQQLVFYGSSHTNDPNDPQFTDLEERWKAFISKSTKPVVLVEGQFDQASEEETNDKVQSIIAGGEAQFMVHLARRDGVQVNSPEPDRVWEATKLANEFGRGEVTLYYFVRQLKQWNLYDEHDIEEKAIDMLGHMQRTYQWDDVDFSMQGMRNLHEAVFGRPLDMTDQRWLYDITTPTPQDLVTNVIARRSGELRDEYILEQIERYWAEGHSLFAVFGSTHAIRLEPALLTLGGEEPHAQSSKPQ